MGICDDGRRLGLEAVDEAYNPMLKDLAVIIENMTKRGLDPSRYYDAKSDQFVNLLALLSDIGVARDSQIQEVNKQADDCDGSMESGQAIVDMVVARFTGGLSLILPKHMTHIDFEEIISGKPLGGPNSVFNQARSSLFNALGLGENNDLRKVIENPIVEVKKGVNDLLKNAGLPFRL